MSEETKDVMTKETKEVERGRSQSHIPQAEVYGNYAPKIMLETISAGTAALLIAITYLTFIPLFYWDLRSTMSGFEDGNRVLLSQSCQSQGIYPGVTESDYGCTIETDTQFIWIGHVTKFENIIAVALQGKLNNITDLYYNGTKIKDDDFFQDIAITYDVELYTCYDNFECGLPPKDSVSSIRQHNSWKLVLKELDRKFVFGDVFDIAEESALVQLIPTTFQNQPALPDNGILNSYFVYITYHKQAFEYSSFIASSNYYYKFSNVNRRSSVAIRSLLPIFIFLTLLIIFGYVKALYRKYESLTQALPEQIWILCFLIALVLFQNPVYCVAIWQEQPSPGVVYAVYLFDALAQSSFFSIWLFFADGLNRHFSFYKFYVPKVLLGLLIFGVDVVIITLSFPSITSTLSRSPVEAVAMWNYDTKISFIVFSVVFFALIWLWILWWCTSLYMTAKELSKYPYTLTRYIQLWFRFFTIQATLLTLYYVCQYGISMNYIADNAPAMEYATAEDVSDSINTLFRQQSLLFGKVIFLSVYALILAFFFIPAGALDKDPHARTLHIATSSTYTISESELKPIERLRKKIMKENVAVSHLTNLNPYIFCVDLALELMELSYQTYYDPENYKTISSFGSLNLEKLDYILPSGFSFHDKEHETICYVFKHKSQRKYVVSFRGTSSKQHWNDNLKYRQLYVDFYGMGLTDLDIADGLDPSTFDLEAENERESFADHERKSETNRGSSVVFRNISQRRLHVEAVQYDHSDSENEDDSAHGIERDVRYALHLAGHGAQAALALTSDIITTAASKTPILKDSVLTKVHEGFWNAYLPARKFLHKLLREELKNNPATLYFTGHSLGGALTTLAAYDFSIHSLPRINEYLAAKKKKLRSRSQPITGPSRIKVGMYSFGAPRVGNHNFARDYNIFVPNSFRVVVDGDIVSAVPASGYKHIGTNVILDSKGKGSIIIDPSFVEKYLRMSSKTSIGAHSLYVYRRGLKAVRLATQYLNGQLDETQKRNVFRIDEDHNDVDGIALSQCRSSTMSIDANVMSIAKESSIYVASNLSDDQQDPGLQKQDPEIKKHNQEVSDIDQWATNLQNPSMLEKLFTWIGFGKQNDDIVSDSEVSNTLHLESKE